ncbi:hypothetical protein J8L98_00755 [Pseudoalteromonas sp. MMG013]|uniref:hypothetical protein n=1 Tax=Pseudoalteromonas sp. MMG013 TaxID=2822687 RepID=UPI001B396D8F|nr:hypothetical protein [Pseudoalteromonas sp. MMG013]MBQ4860216.1 hypothetical protein [Pseudoalteromonas sp. MMG013]
MNTKLGIAVKVFIITFVIYILYTLIVGKVESGKAFELMKSSNFTTFEVSNSRFLNDKTGFRLYRDKETLSSINMCIKKLEQVPDYRVGKLKTEKTAVLSNEKYKHKFNIHYYENGIVLLGGGYTLKDLLTNKVKNVGGKVFKSECLYHTINL